MKWFKRFLVAAMLLALLAVTTAYLTPLDVYVPDIEQMLSQNFGRPVKVRHLQIDLLPVPHLTLKEVQIGDKPDAVLQSIAVFFDARSLLQSQRVIHRLVLEQGSVTQELLLGIPAWLQNANLSAGLLRLEKLQFSDIRVITPELVLGPLDGGFELGAGNRLERAWAASADQKVAAFITPAANDNYQIDVGFRQWSPPGYPALTVDSMNVGGLLTHDQFNVSKLSVQMPGLHINGTAQLEWQPEWKLELHLAALDGELGRLLPLLGKPLEGGGTLHAQGRVEVHGKDIHTLPNSLTFDVQGTLSNAALRLPLHALRMLAVDSASSHVTGDMHSLKFDHLAGKLYGGTLHGNAVLEAAGSVLRADVAFDNISAQPLVEALSNEVMLSGTLGGQAKVAAQVNEFDRFPANVQIDGKFQIKQGVLGKVDLVQAASNPLRGGNKGGQTRFDELSGLLSVDGSGYHLKRLKMSSGAVNATGKLDISPQLQLSGSLDADLKGTASLVSMPFTVSGTVRDPVLLPSGSTLAGAAVGTALLGPGLGTALGIKFGSLLHKLFGTGNDQSTDRNSKVQQQNK